MLSEEGVATYSFILRQRLVFSWRTVPFGHLFKQFPMPGGICSLSGGHSFLTLHLRVVGLRYSVDLHFFKQFPVSNGYLSLSGGKSFFGIYNIS